MNIEMKHIPKSKYKRPGTQNYPTSITIHSTGNSKSTIDNEIAYLSRKDNTVYASYHYIVDESRMIEVIPAMETAYHSGNSIGNSRSIGIEMVETGNRDKVLENTVKLTKYLMKLYNISDKNVVRHYDWKQKTNWKKNCPRILNEDGYWTKWIEFKTLLRSDNSMNEKQIRNIVQDEMSKSKGEFKWADDDFNYLKEIGLNINEKRYNDNITRGAVFKLLAELHKTIN